MRFNRLYLPVILTPLIVLAAACASSPVRVQIGEETIVKQLRLCDYLQPNPATEVIITNDAVTVQVDTHYSLPADSESHTPEKVTWDDTELNPGNTPTEITGQEFVNKARDEVSTNTVVELTISKEPLRPNVHGLFGIKFLKNPPANQPPCPPHHLTLPKRD